MTTLSPGGATQPVGWAVRLNGYPQVGQCIAIDLRCVQREYSRRFLRHGTVFIPYIECLC